ncbi:MAG: diguanylate cyclase [Aeromicrobium sp.]|uniref:GGDEF domain-containing protein n=1 Tax=Aeromicrobium sp. TaxID=1871063 RepID=UPI0026190AB9|nr:diguanylate cyclase [Aeromicrobium sp.]MDF1703858.1 diguanylate cyclase [Aeromicrobium sp.]
MTPDATTAQFTSSIVIAAITTYFLLTTVLQYDTKAGRLISVAYVAVTGTGVLTASLPGDGTQEILGAVAAGGITLAFGLLRSGLRLQQLGRSPQVSLAMGAAAVTVASVVLDPVVDTDSVPLALSVVFSAAFALATALDSLRAPAAERPSARVLQAVMLLVTVAIVATSMLIVGGAISWNGPVDVVIAIGTTTAFGVAALCITALRAEDARSTWWGDDSRGMLADFDVPGTGAFRRDAADRIERSAMTGQPVGLVWIEIEDLDDLAEAYGPGVRDRAIVHVGRVIRSKVPPFALLGHLGGGRFVVLTTARARRPIDRVANAVRTGLDERPDDLPLQVGCQIGTSVQSLGAPGLEAMMAEAQYWARRNRATPSPS